MNGPHRLTNSNVNSTVENRIGVYLLFNSRGGPVRYVGMSTKLADRLKDWVDQYSHFEYGYRSSRTKAYRSGAHLYHRHGATEELDNQEHPPRPHKQVKCPVCGIHS
jgi:hypothetical protein